MAFAYAVTKKLNISRSKAMAWGTFTNGSGDVGGDITTGFKTCDFFVPSINSHVDSTDIKHTISGGTVTLVCPDNVDGTWLAIGAS